MGPDKALLHGANLIFLASYLVRDILWLRVLAVAAQCCLIAMFWLVSPRPWDAIAWGVLFSVINVVQIVRLVLERRPVRLSEEEHAIHELAFRRLSPRELLQLLGAATYRDASDGERVITRGEHLPSLFVVLRGCLEVRRDGASAVPLRAGQFVGEMSFLTGRPPSADVVTSGAARLVAFDGPRLRGLLDDKPDLRAAVQAILGSDLAEKLRSAPAPAAG